MTEADIKTKLTAIFRDVFDDDSIVLRDDMTADDIPEWDSMSHVTLVVATEQTFGIKFRTAEIEEMHDVGDFVRLIGAKVEGKAA
ncbi:acyl carrier protein [Lichenicoccus roseus]|uniref:Acyl carrier protein n=1 Tax=Lichenicoccus roseus TaxID=2683649 RepID=A0A5R9J8Q6_9PROT|nr:acyl carrier protein [Lichenicoccus roseus]TLU70598.1 acyl carrier protein [Lichenicoccus roseus]